MFEVRDRHLKKIGSIGEIAKAEVLERDFQPDTWTISVPAAVVFGELDNAIRAGGGIVITDPLTDEVMISGPLRRRLWTRGKEDPGLGTILYSGVSDTRILSARIVLPVWNSLTQNADYYTDSGLAEDVMRRLVERHLGALALPHRRHPRLSLGPAQIPSGVNVQTKARYDVLNDVLRAIALRAGDLGYRVVQVGETLEFQIWRPTDRRDTIHFSPELRNVVSFGIENLAPEATDYVVGGAGDMAQRFVALLPAGGSGGYNDPDQWYDTTEVFLDQTSVTTLAEAQAEVGERRQTDSAKETVTFDPVDTPDIRYRKHYHFKDIVTARIGVPEVGAEITVVDSVRQVKTVWDKEGRRTEITVGKVDSDDYRTPKLFKRMAATTRGVHTLQTRT